MAVLNQPKWRKFLSLKGEPKVKSYINTVEEKRVEEESNSARTVSNDNSPATATPKKRKRTEEEIAQRKAKKLKSKGKEAQEWKKLEENQQAQLSTKEEKDETNPNQDEISEAPKATKPNTERPELNDELLSKKARGVSKARRGGEIQEKQQPQTKQNVKDQQNLDKKAKQVLEYLDAYDKHVETGSEWKFKKQYQNWIVKHLYSYLWKSDDLLIRYLKTVQGGVRERIISEAKEVVKSAEEKDDTTEVIVQRAKNVITALEA